MCAPHPPAKTLEPVMLRTVYDYAGCSAHTAKASRECKACWSFLKKGESWGIFCPCGRQKSRCKTCSGSGVCAHARLQFQCLQSGTGELRFVNLSVIAKPLFSKPFHRRCEQSLCPQ